MLRWWTEGASHDPSKQAFSAGIFGHKELRGYMEAHGMFGANVRPGHHGVGTALNDWQDVERFAVVGVTRLDDDQFAEEVESFFALAPTSDVPRLTKRIGEAGIRLRDGSGYPSVASPGMTSASMRWRGRLAKHSLSRSWGVRGPCGERKPTR